MLKELKEKTYQNFYINEENEIVGIVTPKEKWKIKEPAELQAYYIDKIYKLKSGMQVQFVSERIRKLEKQLTQLTREMNKRCTMNVEAVN
jgi:hypothetical protein